MMNGNPLLETRPWLKSYPAGVPAEVPLGEYGSLVEVMERAVQSHGDKTAYISMGRRLSYRQMADLGSHFAGFLQGELGLARGTRVAIMLPNVLQYPVCLCGVLKAGLTVVNCNPLYTPRELAHQLADSGAQAIVVLENFAHVLEQALAMMGDRNPVRQVVVTGLGDLLGPVKGALVNFALRHVQRMVPAWRLPGAMSFRQALERGARLPFAAVPLGPDDLAFLQYTGGTTGVAKGAMLTHGNMLANLAQIHAWVQPIVRDGQELIVTALPLYHIFSLTANCLLFVKLGAASLLIANPRDIAGMIREMGRYPFTAITGVNTLFNALLQHPDFKKLDFRSLRIALGGGMSVQRAVAERWQALTGVPVIEAYGLTETAPAVTINPMDLKAFNGCIGLPVPSTEVSIRDDEGREQPMGSPGEICVRGPQVMKGYYGQPEETARAMTADGFLLTGDIGIMDRHGFVRLVDRKKDMILVSGFNVYPNEVEDVIAALPGVREVAAVGMPDAHSGEAVKVFIARQDPGLTVEAVMAHCRQNLTGYKLPKAVEFRDQLPKSAVGKILRRALKDEASALG
ncbi:MAG: AMP-binding protein [Rhodocyclaceae bacterium]|nr:AMP-binding protein [Rhodocyclaceae bacterium]